MTNLEILQRSYDFNYETPIITMDTEMENSYFGFEFKTDHYYFNIDLPHGFPDKLARMCNEIITDSSSPGKPDYLNRIHKIFIIKSSFKSSFGMIFY